MIDFNDASVADPEADSLRILAMSNGDTAYCTATKDWAKLLLAHHPNACAFDFHTEFKRQGRAALERRTLAVLAEKNPDVLYFDAPFLLEFRLEFLERLRERHLMAIVTDDTALFFNDWFRYLAQVFDVVFTHDYAEKFRFEIYGTRSYFFPMVSNPQDYLDTPTDLEAKDIPVSSVGRVDRVGRREFLREVASAGVGLHLYGPGTEAGLVSKEKKIEIFRRSKISLNFSGCADYFHSSDVPSIDKRIRQVKGRLWELALTKNLIMTEYAPALERSFSPGDEVVVFQDEKDLIESIRHFQRNEDLRREVALKAYSRALADCTPSIVCRRVVKVLAAARANKRYRPNPIRRDPIHLRLLSRERARSAAGFLLSGQASLAMQEAAILLREGGCHSMHGVVPFAKAIAKPFIDATPGLRRTLDGLRGA